MEEDAFIRRMWSKHKLRKKFHPQTALLIISVATPEELSRGACVAITTVSPTPDLC